MLSASATVMAAGLLITRILLVCFLSELNYSSAFPTAKLGYPLAWQDGEKPEVNGYGTRRPLHYIRSLRRPNRNMQPDGGAKTWQKPKESLSDLSHTWIQKQTPSSYRPRELSTSQETYPLVKPRSFEMNLNVPILDLLHQRTSSTQKDSFGKIGADIFGKKFNTKDLHGRKYDLGLSKPSFPLSLPLSFSLPSLAPYPKPSQGDGGYVANFEIPSKLQLNSQTGLRLPILNFDDGKTLHQFGLIAPFNLDGRRQVGPLYEPILSHLTKLALSNSDPLKINKDKHPSGQSWGFKKLDVMKPQSPDIFRTHVSLPKNYAKAQPDPSKGVQGFRRDSSGSPLIFHKPYDHSQFKPSTSYVQSIKREHSNPLRPYDLPTLGNPNLEAPNYEAKNALKWQKPVSLPYDYSSRREASHVSVPRPNPLALSTEYQAQRKYPGQNTDMNKVKITTDLLQNLKTWLQSNSTSPEKKPQSNLQLPCIDGADCSHMPEKRRRIYHAPKRDDYSPYAEAIAVSLPSNRQYRFESSSNPINKYLLS